MEPCYFDARCNKGGDPYGGLGCNAGGHATCRFCGFGNYLQIPCPTGDSGAKQITVVLAGTMDEVGGHGSTKRLQWESSFKDNLAALIGLHKSRITILDCREASVLVEVLLLPPQSALSSDPTLSLPADAAVERLNGAIAAGIAAETPPPALGGMQVMLTSERIAPPAPPFSPGAMLVSAAEAVDMTVSALSGTNEASDGSDVIMITIGGTGTAILLVILSLFRASEHIQHRRRLAAARRKPEEGTSVSELGLNAPALPPPPLPPGRPLPQAPSAQQKLGEDGFLPVTERNATNRGAAVGLTRSRLESFQYTNKWESQKELYTTREPPTERAAESVRGQCVTIPDDANDDANLPVYLTMPIGGQRKALDTSPPGRDQFRDQFRSALRRAVVDRHHLPPPNALPLPGTSMGQHAATCLPSRAAHSEDAHTRVAAPHLPPPQPPVHPAMVSRREGSMHGGSTFDRIAQQGSELPHNAYESHARTHSRQPLLPDSGHAGTPSPQPLPASGHAGMPSPQPPLLASDYVEDFEADLEVEESSRPTGTSTGSVTSESHEAGRPSSTSEGHESTSFTSDPALYYAGIIERARAPCAHAGPCRTALAVASFVDSGVAGRHATQVEADTSSYLEALSAGGLSASLSQPPLPSQLTDARTGCVAPQPTARAATVEPLGAGSEVERVRVRI